MITKKIFNSFKIENLSIFRTELMGICILWIMLFHLNISPPPSNIYLRFVWSIFFSYGGGFGVDSFFILSGFGLMTSELKKTNIGNWKNWYKRRFLRIIPAYLIVSLSFYSFISESFSDILYNLSFLNFLMEGDRQFWYIFAICFCYIIFPLISYLYKKISFRVVTAFLVLFCLLLCYLIGHCNPIYYQKIEIFLTRIPCFFIGCYLAILYSNKKVSEYLLIVFISLTLGVLLFKGYISYQDSSRLGFDFISLFVLLIFSSLLSLFNLRKTLLFNYCGRKSLELYLVHVSIGGLCLIYFDSLVISLFFYFVISFIISEIVSYVVHLLTTRL